jgi:hypothetical protein
MFGSYDVEGVDPTKKMSVVKASNRNSWELDLTSIQINDVT